MQTMKDLLPFLKWKNLDFFLVEESRGIRLSELCFWDHKVQGSVHNPNVQGHFLEISQEQPALLVHSSDSPESEPSPSDVSNPHSTMELHQLQPDTFQYLTLNIFTQDYKERMPQ